MNWQVTSYFISVILTFLLTSSLTWYAWQRYGSQPVARLYGALALSECLLALTEIVSMMNPSESGALFWFKLRYSLAAILPVFFLLFALEYGIGKRRVSKRVLVALFILPLLTQITLWTNEQFGLWAGHEAGFTHNGLFWIADVSQRVPAIGFLVHVFYSQALMLAGIVFLLLGAWRNRKVFLVQSLLLSLGALVGLAAALIPVFNLIPGLMFSPFIPGIGLSALLYGIAILRHNFMSHFPGMDPSVAAYKMDPEERRALTLMLLVYLLLISGLTTSAYLSYRNYEAGYRQQVDAQLTSITRLKTSGLADWLHERMADARIFLENPVFSDQLNILLTDQGNGQVQQDLQKWMDSTRLAYDYTHVSLLDPSGKMLLSSPEEDRVVPEHVLAQLETVLLTRQLYFLDFHKHANGQIRLGMMVPIWSTQETSTSMAVLVFEIDPTTFIYPYLQVWPGESTSAETLLVRREEEEVLFLNPLRYDPEAEMTLRKQLTETDILAVKAVRGETGIVEGIDYRGEQVIGAAGPVPGSPWYLVARMDKIEVYEPLQTRLRLLVLTYGALILACGVGLILIWRGQQTRYFRARLADHKALQASEEKFRLAFDTSPDSIAITRMSDGRFISVNRGFEQITGWSAQDVVGKTSTGINIWKDPEDRKRVVQILKEKGEVQNYEAPFLTRNGEIHGMMSAAIIHLNGEPHILNITRDITERKQMEDALLESEQFVKMVLDNLPIGVAVNSVEPEVRFAYMNDNFPAFYRTTREELAHPDMFWRAAYEDQTFREKIKERVEEDCASGTLERMVWRDVPITRRGQETTYITARNIPIPGKDLMISTVWDVTERVRAQEEQFKLLRIIDSSLNEIYIFDADSLHFNYLNQGALKNIGFSMDEMASLTPLDIKPEFTETSFREMIQPLLDGSRAMLAFETLHQRKDGSRYHVGVYLQYFRQEEKGIFFAVINDITERKWSQAALKESEEKFKYIFDKSMVGKSITLPDGQMYPNQAFCNWLGYTVEEFGVMRWQEITPPEDIELVETHIAPLLAGSRADTRLEKRYIHKNGSILWGDVSTSMRLDEAGKPMYFITNVVDITSKKQAEQELKEYSDRLGEMVEERTRDLRQAQEKLIRQEKLATLGQLAGSVSHELRNPLGVISNAAYYLTMAMPDANEKIRQYLEIITSETRTAEKIITDLLDFSRNKPAEQTSIEVSRILEQTLKRYTVPGAVTFKTRLGKNLPPVHVDALQMEQVLGNLIVNACQSMPEGGNLTLSSAVKGKFIALSVEDSGEGITAENMIHIFEPLFTTRLKGIGLGLAVSKQLVEANGGRIEVQSTPGKGSKFTIYLPKYLEAK